METEEEIGRDLFDQAYLVTKSLEPGADANVIVGRALLEVTAGQVTITIVDVCEDELLCEGVEQLDELIVALVKLRKALR